jgi:hypothetical protein
MEMPSDQAPAVETPKVWRGLRVAEFAIGALAVVWNAWWIADTVATGNLFDGSKPLGVPVPFGEMFAAAFWGILGLLAALNAVFWRYDGSWRGKAVLVGAAGYALLALAIVQAWNAWTFESFNWIVGL